MTQQTTASDRWSSSRLEGIDVLRGLAALTVVFSHYIPYWHRYLDDIVVLVPGSMGYHAVELFFVISGMVIFMTLEKCKTAADFAWLRFSRLFPTYWTTLGIATFVTVVIFGQSFWLGGFIVNTTMFQEFLGYPNLDNVYWSLTVELAFYLNVAWVFALGLHKKINACLVVWLSLSAIWALTLFDPGRDDRDWLSVLFAFDYAPFFAFGILFYKARGRRWTSADVGLLVMTLVVQFLIASWQGVTALAISAMLVFAGLSGYLRFLTNKLTLWLGAISYSLYLIHRNIAYNILPWLHEQGFGPIAGIAVTVIGMLGLAAAVTFLVERPASRRMRSWHRRKA